MSRPKQVKNEERLTVKEYADRKKKSERTIYRWIKAGLIKTEQPRRGYPHEIIV